MRDCSLCSPNTTSYQFFPTDYKPMNGTRSSINYIGHGNRETTTRTRAPRAEDDINKLNRERKDLHDPLDMRSDVVETR